MLDTLNRERTGEFLGREEVDEEDLNKCICGFASGLCTHYTWSKSVRPDRGFHPYRVGFIHTGMERENNEGKERVWPSVSLC